MPGIGTLVNVTAIILGGLVGLLLHGGLKPRFQEIMMKALGLATIFIGASGAIRGMLEIEDGQLVSADSMAMVFALVLGAFVGEALNIEKKIERFGEFLKRKFSRGEDSKFVDAFVSATMVVCVGAMAVVGALQDGLHADAATLYTKAVLDFSIIIIMASTMGKGVIFSVIPLAIFQGSITLLARLIEPVLTPAAVNNLSFIGSILIFAVGINLAFGKKFKVGNFLPVLLFAVLFGFFM